VFIDNVIKQKGKIKQLINSNSKIFNITQKGCQDGCGCSLILKKFFKNVEIIESNYDQINKVLENVATNNQYDCVFITDISPDNNGFVLLENIKNLIMIDHHDTAVKYNNPEKLIFVDNECSATKLLYMFMNEVFEGITLNSLEKIVTYINDYDMWVHEYPESKQLNLLLFWFWNDNFINRFISGNVIFNKNELDYIRSKEQEFNNVFNNTNYYDLEKLNGCFVIGDSYVNDICDKLLKEKGYNIVLFRNTKSQNVSVRHNLEYLHIGNTLQLLGIGGGHKNAGGIVEKDVHLLYDKISKLEKHLYENVKELRKYK
jgi:oligoribonuclease NrnB/cAMP/cGMP phosphodiesterase (DHH superfamily)